MLSLASRIYFIFIISEITISCTKTDADYYWREYTGKIPEDAVVAGKDINGGNVYIGQAYIKNEGLITVQIKEGDKEVFAPNNGPKRADDYIKILCGYLENFVWLRSNGTHLHLDLLDKQAVIGGHDDGHGRIGVGRISYEGSVQIGKVNTFNIGIAWFYWINKFKQEVSANSFEILIFQRKNYIVH